MDSTNASATLAFAGISLCLGAWLILDPNARQAMTAKQQVQQIGQSAEVAGAINTAAAALQETRQNCTPVEGAITEASLFNLPANTCIENNNITATIDHQGKPTNILSKGVAQ